MLYSGVGPCGGRYTTTPPVANVYLSKGGGTFSSSPIPGVGPTESISGFGVGDINGDLIPDLVLDQSTTVQFQGAMFLPGKGDGTFGAATPLTLVGPAPTGPVSIQDLNKDGNADLFYQGYCPGTRCGTIALGNGDGTFSTTLPVLLGFPILVSTADLNGDGLPDLVLAGSYGSVAVMLNNGFGSVFDLPGNTVSTATLTAAPNPATVGQSITFTATVAAGSGASGTPTGTVTFLSGSTSLGTGTLSSGSAAFSTSSLAAGTYSINASYGGDSTFAASTSAAVSVTVNAAPVTIATTTTLTASATSAVVGTSLTFAAAVTPASGNGAPTGSVAFSDGTTQLGTGTLDSSGKATYSTSSLAVDTHSIRAVYGGDTSYTASTSSTVSVTITAASADFSISLARTSGTVSPNSSVTSAITIASAGGFDQAVSLSCSGAPRNATCSVSPASVTPTGTSPGSATLTIRTGIEVPASTRLNSAGRSSGSIASVLLSCCGFLSLSALRRRRRPGWTTFLAAVALSCGLIGTVAGCGGSSHSTPAGTYTITVTATSGADSHTAT